jgi:glucokinase
VLGIDVGGTYVKGVVVSLAGRLVCASVVAAPSGGGAELVAAVTRLAGALLEQAEQECGVTVARIGVVVPGHVDEAAGRVRYAANLAWADVDLVAIFERALHRRVTIAHDVRAAVLAEHLLGGARGERDFALVALGTGISCGIYVDGRLVSGASGAAGEIGHIRVAADGEACSCGQVDCLEVYASAAGVARRYRDLSGDAVASAKDVVERWSIDADAELVLRRAVEALGAGIAVLTLLFDPALVLLGGGLSRAGGVLLEPTLRAITERLTWRAPPRIALGALGACAGQLGSALVALGSLQALDAVQYWNGSELVEAIEVIGEVWSLT